MVAMNHAAVVGVFDQTRMAQMAVDDLKRNGFREDRIGVASRWVSEIGKGAVAGTEGQAEPGDELSDTYAEEGAVAGAATGAGIGALWALAVASGIVPGIGIVVAGGILASVLGSAAAGAVAGGAIGALVGLGIPEEEARYYESELRAGRTIVAVRTPDRYDEASAILRRNGAINLGSPSERNEQAVRDKREEERQRAEAAGHTR